MSKVQILRTIMTLVIISFFGIGLNSSAAMEKDTMEKGKTGMMKDCPMSKKKGCKRDKSCKGMNVMKGLNETDKQKMEEEIKSFHDAIADKKQNLFEKQAELINVFSQKEPDAKKAKKIQKKISKLQSRIDRKKIDHLINVKNINPNVGTCFIKKRLMYCKGSSCGKDKRMCPMKHGGKYKKGCPMKNKEI